MPEAFILIYGAAVMAPVALFGILIWSGLERRLEASAREWTLRGRLAPPAPLMGMRRRALVRTAPRRRTAA